MRYVWIPRLLERIRATPESESGSTPAPQPQSQPNSNITQVYNNQQMTESGFEVSGDSLEAQVSPGSDLTDCYNNYQTGSGLYYGSGEFDSLENMMWNDENIWFLQQQLCDDDGVNQNIITSFT